MFETLKALFSANKDKDGGEKRKEKEIRDQGKSIQPTRAAADPDMVKKAESKAVEFKSEESKTVESKSVEFRSERSVSGSSPAKETENPTVESFASRTEMETGSGNRSRKKKDASRDFYRYLNQAIKTMHIRYSEGRFDELTHLGKIPSQVVDEYDQIIEKLPEDLRAWVSALRAMIVLRDDEGAIYTDIGDKEGIKKEFLGAMLPFYGTYAAKLGEGRVRFSSLIGPEMLNLFHELTGKKFSVGFHRRYESGINAFEWENDRYQVYDSKGHLLCDATFKDGMVDHGYAEAAEPDPEHEDWDLVRAGMWEDGEFKNGAIRYVYRIKVE